MQVSLGTRWQAIADENDALKFKVGKFQSQTAQLSTLLEETQHILNEKTAACIELTSKLAICDQEVSDLRLLVHRYGEETANMKQQMFDAKNRICELEDTLELRDERIEDILNKLEYQRNVNSKLAATLAVKEISINDQEKKISGKQAEIDKIFKELDLFKKVASQRDTQIAAYAKKQAQLSQQVANLRASLDLERASARKREPVPASTSVGIGNSAKKEEVENHTETASSLKRVTELEAENRQLKRALERERLRIHKELTEVNRNQSVSIVSSVMVNPWSEEDNDDNYQ